MIVDILDDSISRHIPCIEVHLDGEKSLDIRRVEVSKEAFEKECEGEAILLVRRDGIPNMAIPSFSREIEEGELVHGEAICKKFHGKIRLVYKGDWQELEAFLETQED